MGAFEQTIQDLPLDQRRQRSDAVGLVQQTHQSARCIDQIVVAAIYRKRWKICLGRPGAFLQDEVRQHRLVDVDLATEVRSLAIRLDDVSDERQVDRDQKVMCGIVKKALPAQRNPLRTLGDYAKRSIIHGRQGHGRFIGAEQRQSIDRRACQTGLTPWRATSAARSAIVPIEGLFPLLPALASVSGVISEDRARIAGDRSHACRSFGSI